MESSVSDDAFAQYLHRTGMARPEQIEHARQQQAEAGANGVLITLGETLVQLGIITEAQREDAQKNIQARQSGPRQLGNYRLIRKLGEGGMGAVYQAEDTLMRRPVAIKLLLDKHAHDEHFLARFRREIRAIGSLNHPNIVAAYAVGEEIDLQYFVMEYCEGEPLDVKLKRAGRLEEREAIEIVIQTAQGLQHAHQQGFIHRDIKPGNIFITREGTAKVLDMGLSKDVVIDAESSFNTQSGVTLGTPHYVSPEQAECRPILDGRTDIYSLGSTLFHLVTGKTPYKGSTLTIITAKITKGATPDPRAAYPGLSNGIVSVILKMMAKDPAHRYQSCGELIEDLERIRDGKPPLINDPATQTVSDARTPVSKSIGASTTARTAVAERSDPFAPASKIATEIESSPASINAMLSRNEEPPTKSKPRSNLAMYALVAASVVVALFVGVALGSGKSTPLANNDVKNSVPLPSPVPATVTPPPAPAPVPIAPPPPTPVVVQAPSTPPPAPGKWTFLSDLPETIVRTIDPNNPQTRQFYARWSFGKGKFGRPEADGQQIRVSGQLSPHGLAMNASNDNSDARVSYTLGKRYQTFIADAGIHDGAAYRYMSPERVESLGSQTALSFIVLGDGKELWRSRPLRRAGESQSCSVSVSNVEKLELVVDCPGPWWYACGAWVEPRLVPSGGK